MPNLHARWRFAVALPLALLSMGLAACNGRRATPEEAAAEAPSSAKPAIPVHRGPSPVYANVPATPAEDVLTYHNNLARTGLQPHESLLTPADVNPSTFGKQFSDPVDGFVYAQPLNVAGVSVPGKGRRNVVYVGTENDSVYAFDAGQAGPPLWHKSLLEGGRPVSSAEIACGQIIPRIGITSTPVIDPSTGTLYVVAVVKHPGTKAASYVQRLHALDIATGAEKFGGPVTIAAKVPGKGAGSVNGQIAFDASTELNRAGLALSGGVVYIGFASHCDEHDYHGWLLAYDARHLSLRAAFNATPNGSQGAIWQTGDAPAIDATGHIFVMTGNGTFDANSRGADYGDSFIDLALDGKTLRATDFFTPFNQEKLNINDLDVGSGGTLLLPDQPGPHAHLVVGGGKNGVLYVVDRDHMGRYRPGDNGQIVQEISGTIAAIFSTPAYWHGHLYVGSIGKPLQAYRLEKGRFSPSPVSQTPNAFNYPGTTPGVSSSEGRNAIVWALDSGAYQSGGPAVLNAYDANNLARQLYSSAKDGSGHHAGPAVKFITPTIAHGRVYFGTEHSLDVYGLLSPAARGK